MNRKILSFGLVGLAFAGAIYLLLKKPATPDDEPAPATMVDVHTGVITRATLHGYIDGFGTVSPAPARGGLPPASARVASPVAGVVAKSFVSEGEPVARGAALFDLDDRAAQAAVERARSAARNTQAAADRQHRLLAEQNTSARAVQDAEAQDAAARADLAAAETQLAWMHITAPLAGVVTHVNVRPGEAVDLTTVLAEITDPDRLIISAEIPAFNAGELKSGQIIEVTSDPAVNATLTFVSPSVDPVNDTVTVNAALPKGTLLRPGQYVRLRIITAEHRDGLAVPAESVVRNAAGAEVVAVVQGDEATQVPVRTGLHDGGLVEIEGAGLQAGAAVVTVGAYGLPEKTKVHVIK